ncbi:hypothetical protein VPNG_03101 [Cytospora leucostoma]|uniref:Ketosynthase family 3 (KS3) domain-containing protein n=1 Tax=Cytospora leucostoma TaxID=1230097 RepID=A0A423XGE5_9PEZI|nr:hypothetical protein VPNG_03101 [Cytospora leucostoma]
MIELHSRNGLPLDGLNGTNETNSTETASDEAASGYTKDASYAQDTNGTRTSPPPAPIAVCGIALRLPGGIRTTEALWDVLSSGKDLRSTLPPDRFNISAYDTKNGRKGAVGTHHGYFLSEDLAHFDTSFFNMSKLEVEKTDPQQRKLLEVTRECLENAGEIDYRGKLVGCFVGTFGEGWLLSHSKENQFTGGYNLWDLMLANRLSYEYDFQGPSVVIKTGCSASLVGLHEACRALQGGDCTSALVAGTSLIMGPSVYAAMTSEGVLSADGSCKTFDATADGFARADGINAVYLKRLDNAIRDGNPVRAIIRNTGSNSDGKSLGMFSPRSSTQGSLVRKMYADAGLDPTETAFVECHGTGTATWDPIETTAVGNVFGEKGVYIGSVKPDVGHSEGASGLTSLIKGILALEHKTIPPNIKFVTPNPKRLSIVEELYKSQGQSQVYKAEVSQPLCTAIQIGLVNSLSRLGIRPDAVLGHSSGEIAAAHTAGLLTVREALVISYLWGFATSFQTQLGGMAAVGLSADDVTSNYLAGNEGVVIAAENSPQSTTISGDVKVLERIVQKIKEDRPNVLARSLQVDMAYHSHQMTEIGYKSMEFLHHEMGDPATIAATDTKVPLLSTVTEQVIQEPIDLGYWVRNLTSPVRFNAACKVLLYTFSSDSSAKPIFLEIGPYSQMGGPLREVCTATRTQHIYIPTMLRAKDCADSLLSAVGQLFQHGVALDLASISAAGGLFPLRSSNNKVLTNLPPYPWDHSTESFQCYFLPDRR